MQWYLNHNGSYGLPSTCNQKGYKTPFHRSDHNCINNATGGLDYDSGPYAITFTAGVTSIPFDVPINDDNILEQNEEFTLTILQDILPDGVTRGSADQTIVTIVDDDGKQFNYVITYSHVDIGNM